MRQQRLLDRLVRRVDGVAGAPTREAVDALVEREWLITNGIGGYASGSIANLMTRRYHGLLVAALPNPIGRLVMLNRLEERVTIEHDSVVRLDGEERVTTGLHADGATCLREFVLEAGLPVWRYALDAGVLERRVVMPHGQNTVHVRYHLVEGDAPMTLELRPAVHFRGYEDPVSTILPPYYRLVAEGTHYVLVPDGVIPPLRFYVNGAASQFALHAERIDGVVYRVERRRGYDSEGSLWSPGHFTVTLTPGRPVSFIASTEPWETMTVLEGDAAGRLERERRRRLLALAPVLVRGGARPGTHESARETAQSAAPPEPREAPPDDPTTLATAELVLAADQFIITPTGRNVDAAIARAVGDGVRTVIAGYHWFTDWGRDTMISLDGLTLATGRHREAGYILRTFARYVRDGLIPNMFPDGSNEGLYHTADATLWFFQALHRYLAVTGDADTLSLTLPVMRDIVRHHLEGTRFGIGVDPSDGLLRQGEEGYQLTWMDAKVGDWVVTPRRGKAVEINALWYNALCLLESWLRARGDAAAADETGKHATRARTSFNRRLWYDEGGYLYDVIDGPHGDSAECRPNQLFAISLEHPVLDESRWASVVQVCGERLLTPVGLRSLAPGSPDYRARYDGDLRSRDAAYHQGTVWGWLIGPWIDAWLRVHPGDHVGARRFLDGMLDALDRFGIGSIAEIFDAEPPYTPRGCIAQAWSVGETLRCLEKTRG